VLATLLLTCCAAPGLARAASAPVAGTFVGSAGASGPSVAVAAAAPKPGATAREVVVYVCDGAGLSEWFRFPALVTGNSVDLKTKSGLKLHATLTRAGVTGTVDLPGRRGVAFSAAPATGIAGLYLLESSVDKVRGISGFTKARLTGTVTRQASGGFRIAGTVVAPGKKGRALSGSGALNGPLSKSATWIVSPTGQVKGQAGGGNCSLWSSIKEALFGVSCRFFARA
jgi:hypothetical protein